MLRSLHTCTTYSESHEVLKSRPDVFSSLPMAGSRRCRVNLSVSCSLNASLFQWNEMAGTPEKVEFDPSVDGHEGLGNLCCSTERSEVLRMIKPAGASNVILGGP